MSTRGAQVSVASHFQGQIQSQRRLNTQIVLRICRAADIASVIRYFETEKPEHFEAVGIDLRLLPSITEVREDLEALCAELDRVSAFSEFLKCATRVPLVFSLGERLIGHLVLRQELDHLTGLDAWFAHSHIWLKEDRACGVGTAIVPLMIEFIEKYLPIQRLILEMSAENIAMIRVLEKEMSARDRPFIRVPDYFRPAHGITRAMQVARFEIGF